MRKSIFVALALSPLFLAAGCGGDDDKAPPKGGGKKTGVKKLAFWHIQTKDPTKGVIGAAVKRFEAANPGVDVEVTTIENDAFKNKLRVAMTAGSPPDVFHTWGGGVLAADARAGRVLDLGANCGQHHFIKYHGAAFKFCFSDGKLLALPADVAAVVLSLIHISEPTRPY